MAEEVDENALLILLNGIFRIDYENAEIPNEELKSECYPNFSLNDFNQILDKMSQLIRTMASSDMDLKQTEAFLTSQTKRRDGRINEMQAKTLAKFWKIHRSKIHEIIVKRSAFGTATLEGLSWRIEVPTHQGRSTSRSSDRGGGGGGDPLAPVAVVQMKCNPQGKTQKQCFNFELDEKDLASLLRSMDEIDARITEMSNSEN